MVPLARMCPGRDRGCALTCGSSTRMMPVAASDRVSGAPGRLVPSSVSVLSIRQRGGTIPSARRNTGCAAPPMGGRACARSVQGLRPWARPPLPKRSWPSSADCTSWVFWRRRGRRRKRHPCPRGRRRLLGPSRSPGAVTPLPRPDGGQGLGRLRRVAFRAVQGRAAAHRRRNRRRQGRRQRCPLLCQRQRQRRLQQRRRQRYRPRHRGDCRWDRPRIRRRSGDGRRVWAPG